MNATVGLVADRFPPASGGTERHVESLARRLHWAGHRVHVIALPHPGEPAEVDLDGVAVHRIDGWRKVLDPLAVTGDGAFHPPAPDPGLIGELGALFTRLDVDLVHAHGWIAFSAVPAARRARVPVVVSVHDHGMTCGRRTLLHVSGAPCPGPALARCLTCAPRSDSLLVGVGATLGLRFGRSVLRGADAVVANSAATAESLKAGGITTVPVTVVPPYLSNVDPLLEPPDPTFPPPQRPYLLFAGGTAPHKGLDVLLGAWGRVEGEVDLLVAGPGSDELAHRADLDRRVRVLGHVMPAELRRSMAGARAVVVPSVWPEAFGLVVAEAFAAGCPVVASRIGALPELVEHEQTGLLVEPGRRGALAAAMQRLVDDPALAGRLGREAHARHDRLDGFASIERVYERVLELRSPAWSSSGGARTKPRASARSNG